MSPVVSNNGPAIYCLHKAFFPLLLHLLAFLLLWVAWHFAVPGVYVGFLSRILGSSSSLCYDTLLFSHLSIPFLSSISSSARRIQKLLNSVFPAFPRVFVVEYTSVISLLSRAVTAAIQTNLVGLKEVMFLGYSVREFFFFSLFKN